MKNFVAIGALFFTFVLSAQIEHPKASPFTQIQQQVGLTNITVEYSRPAVRGRKIFGDLVPYGRIWRVGANESTKITLDTDVKVMGQKLPMGTYALYAFPEKESWEIVFHGNTGHWGDGRKNYNPEEDVLRVTVKPEKIPALQENFLISFDAISHNSVHMLWHWDHTRITIPLEVDTDGIMRKRIAVEIEENPTAQTYYEAARYLQEQGTDHEVALEYLEEAIRLGGDTYYFHRVKSLVEATLGNYAKAITSAQLSLELAKAEEKDEFVRMNEKNIKKWNKILKEEKR